MGFVQYLFCTNRNNTDSCGECPSCRKILDLQHPDVHFSFPVVQAIGKRSDFFLNDWREKIKSSPYFNLNEWTSIIDEKGRKPIIGTEESNEIIKKVNEKKYEKIKGKFIKFDFLSVADNGEYNLFKSTKSLDGIPIHDFVIVNPPYLATKIDSRFETSKSGDLYSYFLENIIKSSKGFISITPQSFTNAQKFKSLRRLLLNKFSNIKIFAFDNVPANIFKGIKFGSTNSFKYIRQVS